jgi:hypothetical protein
VTAREDELEPLVGNRRLVQVVLRGFGNLEEARLRDQRSLAPDPVDRAVPRGRDEPRSRVRRRAVARPALGGDRERLLRGFLGEVEVAEEADQGCDDAAPFVAKGLVEDR